MKKLIKLMLRKIVSEELLLELQPIYPHDVKTPKIFFADEKSLGKAKDFIERFRELVSDPINLAIERAPNAGYVDRDGNVVLHNGLRVPLTGAGSYYEGFSEILVINRGVHEPLEEYCFQELLTHLQAEKTELTMLELGAYWGHYSMWFSKSIAKSACVLVEPDINNIEAGRRNFARNGFSAQFINEFVSQNGFTVDGFMQNNKSRFSELTLLHSDIQGYEEEMLMSSEQTLSTGGIKYLMISTHSRKIHDNCAAIIGRHGYHIEVSSEPDLHSTSFDGFIFARRSDLNRIICTERVLGRVDIANSTPDELLRYLNEIMPA